jgi:hypothetical protein
MLVAEVHHSGGAWVFYVIAPLIFLGALASFW